MVPPTIKSRRALVLVLQVGMVISRLKVTKGFVGGFQWEVDQCTSEKLTEGLVASSSFGRLEVQSELTTALGSREMFRECGL